MIAVDKALWFIENHYRDSLTLPDLANVVGVSPYHLSRIFCYTVGHPVSRYLRLRRLSVAAVSLAAGESDILNLALSLGYGSHEAFSRAFKEYFNLTPEQVRDQGHTNNLPLIEATYMPHQKNNLVEPQIKTVPGFRIAGLARHYPFEKVAEIPDQWQSFTPMLAGLSDVDTSVTYGVIYHSKDDSFDYLTGVALADGAQVPKDMVALETAAQEYAVFQHEGHVAHLRATCDAIWSDWLPTSGYTAVEAPWMERYGERFDPMSGNGGLEIWIPVSR